MGIAVPWVGDENDLFGIWVEPCSPPREGAVCKNMVAAGRHQTQVFVRRVVVVVVHKDRVLNLVKHLACRGDVIGKDEESCIPVELAYSRDRILVVVHRQEIYSVPSYRIVTSAKMQGDGALRVTDLFKNLKILSRCGFAEGKFSPQLLLYTLRVLVTQPPGPIGNAAGGRASYAAEWGRICKSC